MHGDFEREAIAVADGGVRGFPYTDFDGFVALLAFGVVELVGRVLLRGEDDARFPQAGDHALGGGFGFGESGLLVVTF